MKQPIFQWAIIGAGPAGIAALGKLLDSGIDPATVLWIDPYFQVGDFGRYWHPVSSNTKVGLFIKFLQEFNVFCYQQYAPSFQLDGLPKEHTCLLKDMVEPLQWITDNLIKQVHSSKVFINRFAFNRQHWCLSSEHQTFYAKNVILATGAVPTELDYPNIETISLMVALDRLQLQNIISKQQTIAVFGSSHSAIVVLKHLVDLGIENIINFYRSACRYAVDKDGWILYDNTGLKGEAARWAKQHIDGELPRNITRVLSTEENISALLPTCNKVIYAIGFKPRNPLPYNAQTGIIQPGLFGLGIGFPELKADALGNLEFQVGLWKFMVYLNAVFPNWLEHSF